MALRIISADERLAALQSKNTVVIFGPPNVGKTSQIWTLDQATTLFIDIEAGMKSVQDWPGDSIPVRAFTDFTDVACLIGGANPALRDRDFFSVAHHEHVAKAYAGLDLKKYTTLFVDSITDLTRIAMHYAKTTPYAVNEHGKDDIRGAYGELGRQVIDALKHLQHAPMVNIVFVGILELEIDKFKRETWQPQMEGAKAGRELPGIVNNVVTMSWFDFTPAGPIHNPEKGEHRAFVCQKINPWSLPAKDRSGNLDLLEEPHLGKLIAKMNRSQRAASERLIITKPTAATAF
jgi:hypothetical protein